MRAGKRAQMHNGGGIPPSSQHDGEPADIAALRAHMAAMARGTGDPDELIAAVRSAELLVALLDHGRLWTCELEGALWLFAFTTARELRDFVQRKWAAARPGDLPIELAQRAPCMRLTGAELLEDLIPALMERDHLPYGLALDVTSSQRAFLPPLPGIVPDHAALDLDAATGTGVGGAAA
ncbi:hypothetical protein QQM39_10885 [Streptomyces sp. DT2A-34]|uniref:hypothetical protein n=1 Tax=Streptomyces sp. DT2A-34 TaxID=3051182 RepID=UPI00265BF0EF|nr:hypothetical protein [Streptomyces sp. DT2A-34]MDO0911338.1 hypothetical protein [Streptomyces sp. DT2A-34]